ERPVARPATRTMRPSGRTRSAGSTLRSAYPIVAMSVRWATVSPDEEFHPGGRPHDESPSVLGVGQPGDRPFRFEFPHVMIHRCLVDSECLLESGLREVRVAVGA